MEKQKLNVVWLKRDLRSQDHLPFFLAEKEESPFIALYLYEPDLMISADNSQRHWRFCYQSVIDLNQSFSKTNKKVEVMFATARDAFSYLLESYDLKKVFSYQESGTERTWLRDLKLNQLFLSKNVKWVECQRDGVQRGRKDRKDWEAIEAGKALAEKGVSAEIINIHTIKPLDTEAIIESAKKTRAVVSCEEHSRLGGLGDSIAQTLVKSIPTIQEYVAVDDSFGESGTPRQLLEKYGLTAKDIIAAAEKAIARKNG